jgi:ubiquinone/menaquinone biosynthesis C-methylase UbiE
LAGLKPSSKILDIACGRGVASINLVKKFGCRATAVDIAEDFIKEGKGLARAAAIPEKINFIAADFNTLHFKKNSFDMIIAEGGALSFIGRDSGLKRAYRLLKKHGYIEISDLILRAKAVSKNIKEVFAPGSMDIETEESYRTLLKLNGFEIIFCSHIAQHYWNDYYENIKQNLKNRRGIFSDKNFREDLTREMEVFYKQKGIEQLGYLFIVAKKK